MNQLTRKTSNDGTFTYTYDKRGNMTEERLNNIVQKKYEYDSSNRMVKGTAAPTNETSEYIYNGIGQRVVNIKTVNNPNYAYRNNENSPASERLNGSIDDLARLNRPEGLQKTYLDNYAQTRQTQKATIRREYTPDTTNGINTDLIVCEEGSYVTRFVYGYERISQTTFDYPNKTERGIEGWNPSTDVSTEDVDKVYTHTYKNGSTAYTTDQLGRTRHYAEYGDWGNILTPELLEMNYSGIDNVNPYTVHEYDTVLDKYFAQYRLYDAGNRRFSAKDPIKSGLNWYEYCLSNPMGYWDPTGLIKHSELNAIAVAFTYANGRDNYDATKAMLISIMVTRNPRSDVHAIAEVLLYDQAFRKKRLSAELEVTLKKETGSGNKFADLITVNSYGQASIYDAKASTIAKTNYSAFSSKNLEYYRLLKCENNKETRKDLRIKNVTLPVNTESLDWFEATLINNNNFTITMKFEYIGNGIYSYELLKKDKQGEKQAVTQYDFRSMVYAINYQEELDRAIIVYCNATSTAIATMTTAAAVTAVIAVVGGAGYTAYPGIVAFLESNVPGFVAGTGVSSIAIRDKLVEVLTPIIAQWRAAY